MKAFEISGGKGTWLELEDGRYCDTVGEHTTEQLEALRAEVTEHVLEPMFAMKTADEMAEYVGAEEVKAPTHWSIRRTEAREAQVAAIERATGLHGVAAVVDHALATTLAQHNTEVRTMEKITEILYQYEADDAAMFGPDAEIGEVDTRASYNAFEDAVQKALKAAYPTARISVQSGPSKLRVNWMTDTEEVSVVEDIIHEVWESWNWLVAA